MRLKEELTFVRNEVGIDALFPITHLNAADLFETKDGFMGAVISFKGVSFALQEPDTLNGLSNTLHQVLSALDERFILYITTHRKKENISLEGEFSSPLAKHLNDKYHARFKNTSLYQNHLYLTVILKGDTSSKVAKSIQWVKRLVDRQSDKLHALNRESAIATLNQTMNQLMASLSRFNPHRLGARDNALGYSELLSFLSLIPCAGHSIPFKKMVNTSVISKSIPETWVDNALYPQAHIGHYVSAKHIFFGKVIQFQGAPDEDKTFALMLSLKQYGKETASTSLTPLLSLDSEFIATHTFAPMARDAALHLINLKRSKLINANDLGVTQIDALQTLEDDIASDNARLGYHHNTLMLMAPTIDALNKAVTDAVKAYAASGIVAVKERVGVETAFWSQIPGNHALIVRASPITSYNFIDFCPLYNLPTGFRDDNHLGAAVTLLETPAKTPVFFNYHGRGSKTNPAKGHALVFGSNNAGKTTLVSFMDSQMNRYQGRSFFLDRDEASKIYILASGNSRYTVISPKYQNDIRMNPLQLEDSETNRSFVKSWFGELLKRPNEDDLPADIVELVNECINYNFEHLDKPYRNLSTIARFFAKNFKRWPELKRWLKGDASREQGEFHWLFDNCDDALQMGFDKVGFDITYLIDNVTSSISTPVYMYLVFRMEQCLDGRLTTFNIDEAFQVFNSPFWVRMLRTRIPTIRKKNGHFVFITQSPQTVIDSAISPIILDNVASLVIFPNALASREVYINHLKLSETEYQALLTNPPESRLFLYKQEREAILCKLDLSDLKEEMRILSGNEKSVRLLNKIIEEVGDNPDVWMPVFLKRSESV